jgi:peroxiredoxin Q/BCP
MPPVGRKAPAFTLDNQDGKKVKLADFAGRSVLLFAYPKAGTGG